jgi:tetrahydromethanopterin S-methyltransferase subunit F
MRAVNKKIREVQEKIVPILVKPAAMELGLIVEDIRLDENYFSRSKSHTNIRRFLFEKTL